MQRAYARLILTLVIAGALSCLAGLLFGQTIARVPEGLACNIDEAVGAYAVLIYAVLGPIIFAVTLGIARNRRALAGATSVLIAPLLVFFGVASIETWRYVGFDAYSEWRKFLVTFMPPILAVLVQSLILRAVTGSDRKLDQFPEKNNTDGGSIPFPTE
jgi:cytochrome bd-type quinol oxidase subunit 2